MTFERRIFINYRRNDCGIIAGRIYDRLVTAYGKSSVFMDVSTIEIGREFRGDIQTNLESCQVAIILLGNCWANGDKTNKESNYSRLSQKDDWVRREIEYFIQNENANGIKIIPIFIDGAKRTTLDEETFGSSLAKLWDFQPLKINHTQFDSGMSELLTWVDNHFERNRLFLQQSLASTFYIAGHWIGKGYFGKDKAEGNPTLTMDVQLKEHFNHTIIEGYGSATLTTRGKQEYQIAIRGKTLGKHWQFDSWGINKKSSLNASGFMKIHSEDKMTGFALTPGDNDNPPDPTYVYMEWEREA